MAAHQLALAISLLVDYQSKLVWPILWPWFVSSSEKNWPFAASLLTSVCCPRFKHVYDLCFHWHRPNCSTLMLPSFVWTFAANLCCPALSGLISQQSLLPSFIWIGLAAHLCCPASSGLLWHIFAAQLRLARFAAHPCCPASSGLLFNSIILLKLVTVNPLPVHLPFGTSITSYEHHLVFNLAIDCVS